MNLPVVTHTDPIDTSRRAIVYCYVGWSGPERQSRAIIREAIAELRGKSEIEFDFFAIEEDAPVFEAWLARHNQTVPTGWGLVLWLESAHCVSTEMIAGNHEASQLVARTRALWDKSSV